MTEHVPVPQVAAQAATEPLDPALVPWLEEAPGIGTILKHPLVIQVPLLAPDLANLAYRKKRQSLHDALDAEEWHTAVFLHERPYRTWALLELVVGTDIEGNIPPLTALDVEVRDLAADVWRDSENLHQHEPEWRALLSGDGLALCDDPDGWAALPETLTVYRGEIDDGGFSWTLDRAVAEFFANRWDEGLPITTGRVAKSDVVGYLTGRSEAEVLILDASLVEVVDAGS